MITPGCTNDAQKPITTNAHKLFSSGYATLSSNDRNMAVLTERGCAVVARLGSARRPRSYVVSKSLLVRGATDEAIITPVLKDLLKGASALAHLRSGGLCSDDNELGLPFVRLFDSAPVR